MVLDTGIIRKMGFFQKNTVVSLIVIGIVGLTLRLVNFPYGIPVTLDATSYFWYAIDTNILGHFPVDYKFPNTGWPMLLSVFFSMIHSNNFIDYMMVQRFITVAISLVTIIPVYFICKRFFNRSFALIGAALFAVEPHIIQNSMLGITDSLYVFLISVSFALLYSSDKRLMYSSFAVAALCALVRYEGMLFVGVMSVLFFIQFRKENKVVLKYALAISIYILVLLPTLYLRIENTGNDGLTSEIIHGAIVTNKITSEPSNNNPSLVSFVTSGIENLFKYLGWVMIPYFVIIVPISIIFALKNKDRRLFAIIFSMSVLVIPAVYAYARGIQETRYLLVLMPFFSVLSLFLIERFWNKTSRNVILVLILGIAIASSLSYLELKKTDIDHEREAYEIGLQVTKITKVTNVYYPESKYLKISTISESNFPISSEKLIQPTTTLSTDGFSTLKDFIHTSKDNGLTHLVVDDKQDRPVFLNELFYHDTDYPYLTKIFDSRDQGFKYHVKIYKINYDEFMQYDK